MGIFPNSLAHNSLQRKNIMIIPDALLYTEEHEWIRVIDNKIAVIGITDFAQQQLGDITFVDLPEDGDTVVAGDEFGSIESVKASSDMYSPVSGKILEVNSELTSTPEIINESPYDEGWMIKVELEDPSEIHGLMDPEAYTFHVQRSETEEEDTLAEIEEEDSIDDE